MKEYLISEKLLVFLDGFVGLEYKFKREILEFIEDAVDVKDFIIKVKEYIISAVGEKEYNTIENSATDEYLDYIFTNLEKKGINVTTYLSNDYPYSLFDISYPPLVLYYKGDLSVLESDTFAVVGSRKSLPLSIGITESYAKELYAAGFTLVTGIAEGVDKKVLSTALEVGGKAVSVIAGGLDNIYPKAHAELIEKVAKTGLVLSEYPPQTVVKPFHFPVRNRIIAGLAKGVLIVSGGTKSGTSYTAEYANDFGKDLFAIPYSVGIVSGAGCNDLIKKGAMLTDKPSDILDFYGKIANKQKIQLTFDEREICKVLTDGSIHIEKICAQLNKQVYEITPLLSTLEIKGIVIKSGNVYGLSRNDLEE